MDYGSARFWADIGQWVFNAIVALYLWLHRRNQATVEQVDQNEKDILELRVGLKTLPSQNQIAGMTREIKTLIGEVGEMKGRLGGINRAVDLMNEHLINKEK